MSEEEKIKLLCSEIENEVLIYHDYITSNLMNKTVELLDITKELVYEKKILVEQYLKEIMQRADAKRCMKVWIYSVLLEISHNISVMEDFLNYIILENDFSVNVKYFLFYQLKTASFSMNIDNDSIKFLLWKLFKQIIHNFRCEVDELLKKIPAEECNTNVALVITEQFLGEDHAPTKRCLERCKMLVESGRKVLLINTAECLSLIGEIPFYRPRDAKYDEDYLSYDKITWQGITIPFCQCESNMPNIGELKILIQLVHQIRPQLVISIGGTSILANLINEIVPVLTIGLSAANMEITMTDCQTLSRKLNDSDVKLLNGLGLQQNRIIQSIANFSLPQNSRIIQRSEMGLPENKFIIVIAGNRLKDEIDSKFIKMMCQTVDNDIVFAVIGEYNIEDFDKAPELKEKVYFFGIISNLFGVLGVCDLYVNPFRIGGGVSGVWALANGKPVVTMPYGDVSVNVGSEFWTESYDTMSELIKRYKEDKEFYSLMSSKARSRAKKLIDSDNEFRRVILEFQQRVER